MKNNTENGYVFRAIVAILIGVVLVLCVGIAVSGWQSETDGENSGDNGNTTENADNPDGDTDEDTDGTADNNTQNTQKPDIPEVPAPPEFTNSLTGLECKAEDMSKLPYVFVTDTSAPLYGISDSELVVEIPTENGTTRYLIYRSNIDGLGKIGSITYTRNYISAITKFFGGILVANGKDDILTYNTIATTLHLDLSKRSEATYKENGKNIYTDSLLIEQFAEDEGIDTDTFKRLSLPFEFVEFGSSVSGNTKAEKLVIPYATGSETALTYNKSTGKYSLYKSGREKVDMLTGKTADFTNVFVLFADTVTYEMASGTETVIKTDTSGSGYYVTNGTLREIRWSVNSSGNLIFKDLNSDELIVNRGNSYISYFKASVSNSVTFE